MDLHKERVMFWPSLRIPMTDKIQLNELEHEVIVTDDVVRLSGILAVPKNAKGIIMFAHGSGSGRFSPRNNFVARVLQKAKFATLLTDLLSETEALNRENVFDIELLADRLKLAKTWLAHQSELKNLKFGYFGASTGGGAALVAAVKDPDNIFAVVSRGGRPDLAGDALLKVSVPTLLIVGGNDDIVIDLNTDALDKLTCIKEMKIVPGATHLFEEPGTLEEVADLAKDWFLKYC